jgi:hypothetical protein
LKRQTFVFENVAFPLENYDSLDVNAEWTLKWRELFYNHNNFSLCWIEVLISECTYIPFHKQKKKGRRPTKASNLGIYLLGSGPEN